MGEKIAYYQGNLLGEQMSAHGSIGFSGQGARTSEEIINPYRIPPHRRWTKYFGFQGNGEVQPSIPSHESDWRMKPDGTEIVLTNGYGKRLHGN